MMPSQTSTNVIAYASDAFTGDKLYEQIITAVVDDCRPVRLFKLAHEMGAGVIGVKTYHQRQKPSGFTVEGCHYYSGFGANMGDSYPPECSSGENRCLAAGIVQQVYWCSYWTVNGTM